MDQEARPRHLEHPQKVPEAAVPGHGAGGEQEQGAGLPRGHRGEAGHAAGHPLHPGGGGGEWVRCATYAMKIINYTQEILSIYLLLQRTSIPSSRLSP